MEQLVIDFVKGFDAQTIIAVFVIIWFFNRNLRNEIVPQIIALNSKVEDIDRRLCRIEGALSAKDCCMLKDESKLKKAE